MARNAGFCMGVKRALEMVLARRPREKKETVTYGPLIHNPQVVELLASRKISSSRDFSKLTEDKLGFISAHGVSPRVRRRLRETGAEICDASCPDVIKVQGIIKKHALEGYATVIFGDKGHSEVEGLLGFSEGRGWVVGSVEEAEKLPPLERICLVSQTTQNQEEYSKLIRFLREKFKHVRVFPTICASTRRRQEELEEMIRRIDSLVVVGGRNSANTARLTSMARRRSLPVFQVETADELDMEKIGNPSKIGVTAGASTPNWLIQGVVDRLRDWNWSRKPLVIRYGYLLVSVLVKANLFLALGAASLTYASARLLGLPPRWESLLLSFSYIFTIYNLNIFADQPAILLNQPSRYRFYRHHRKVLLALSLIALLIAVLCAVLLGPVSLLLSLFILLLGLFYSLKIFPPLFSWRRLKDLPGSKEIFSSAGWGTLAVLIPAFAAQRTVSPASGTAVAFAFVFIIMFVRSTLLDIRDLQGDRLAGRETIPVLIGKEKTKVLLGVLTSLLALLIIIAEYRGWIPAFGYYYLAVIAYAYFYLFLYHRRILYQDLFHEMVVDATPLVAGIIAFFAP